MEIRPTDDGVSTLYHPTYDETFHSTRGALREAMHVFIDHSGVSERLEKGRATKVLEVGFGTGFNFLLTADLALEHQTPLEFDSLEQERVPAELLESLQHRSCIRNCAFSTAFMDWYRWSVRESSPVFEFASVRLRLFLGDAREIALPPSHYHAIYMDAFSPDKNPRLWQIDYFQRLFDSCKDHARLTTYCAKGSVRRDLKSAGFDVQRVSGPPGKRHMTIANRPLVDDS